MTDVQVKVLLMEDDDLIAMSTEDLLIEHGYAVSYSAPTLSSGLAAVEDGPFDIAILDINLCGELSFPIADVIVQRKLPFCFVTGYSKIALEPGFSAIPLLQKPYAPAALLALLARVQLGHNL